MSGSRRDVAGPGAPADALATATARGAGRSAGLVLGVDLGGTKMRAALADGEGAILAELIEPTVRGNGEAIVGQVAAALRTLRARCGAEAGHIGAAGLALPVAVDPRSGRSWSFHNVPGLGTVDAAVALREALEMPVVVDNDGNCAALGEGRQGAAIGLADFVVIVLGTGIGSGIVAGGRLVRGAHGGAGEIAFLPLGSDPWEERNRTLGAYETVVAGPAIRTRVDAALRYARPTRLRTSPAARLRQGATLADVAAAATAGDELASRLLDEEARYLALGIAAIAAVVDPELVVLSGGVGAVGGLLGPTREHVAALAARPPRIETGLLGDRAPLLGAVQLGLDLDRSRPRGSAA
jgi:predicted NBD/HSP70 family sugar kinase